MDEVSDEATGVTALGTSARPRQVLRREAQKCNGGYGRAEASSRGSEAQLWSPSQKNTINPIQDMCEQASLSLRLNFHVGSWLQVLALHGRNCFSSEF